MTLHHHPEPPPPSSPPLTIILDWWRWRLDLAERFNRWRETARRINYDGGFTALSEAHGAALLDLNAEWRELERCGDQLRAQGAELESNPYIAPTSDLRQ